jgi:hypothetical protein
VVLAVRQSRFLVSVVFGPLSHFVEQVPAPEQPGCGGG